MRTMKGAAAVLAAVMWCGCRSSPEKVVEPAVSVQVTIAEEADVPVVVRAPATVFAREQANVAPRLTAPIRELRARKGDTVAAGQVLARLESRDLQAQRMEAAAALADAEASLAKMTAGTLPTEIERARGQAAVAAAALNQAQKFYDRRKQLFDQGAIPGRDLLVSETELTQARTQHEVAVKALQLLESQSKERDIEIARSRVEQARGRLSFIDAQLSYAEVRSPFAGTVTEQFLFPGDMTRPDTPVFTVADLSVAVARAQVPEANTREVRRGETCLFNPSDRPGQECRGTVTVVNRAVDPARRTVEVWCEISNGQADLRAGAYGQVEIVTGTLRRKIVLPLGAVQLEEGSAKGVVIVAGGDRRAERREVETAPAGPGRIAVLAGVRAGEKVIVEGGYGLPEGRLVRWEAQ